MKRTFFASGIALAVFVSSASAQAPPPIKLTLTPAKLPAPALRYQLLPDARVTISGDAAPIYQQAFELLKNKKHVEKWEWFDSMVRLPLEKLPTEEVRNTLAEYESVFELLDKAARHDRCDWGLLKRLREKGQRSLPEGLFLQQCGQLLKLRARLDIADGRFDKAIVSLRNGLAQARQIGETDLLTGYLVGLSLHATIQSELEELVGQPGAPNLYYALTDIPVPLIGMRKALQGDRFETYSTFFGSNDIVLNPNAGNMTPQQIEASVKKVEEDVNLQNLGREQRIDFDRVQWARSIQAKNEIAKKALVAAGRAREKVDAMPHVQVALLHAALEYDAILDELLVWHALPYGEASERFREINKQYKEKRLKDPDAPVIAMAQTLLSIGDKLLLNGVRGDRRIALLRTIEAIRFYAATHDGKLPQALAAIKEVPIPLDPVTGKAFEYELVGDVAKLRGPAPGTETPSPSNSVTYELRIRK